MILTNTGKFDGAEVVQLYTHDKVRSVTPPEKELKGFQKVYLKAGESKKSYSSSLKRCYVFTIHHYNLHQNLVSLPLW